MMTSSYDNAALAFAIVTSLTLVSGVVTCPSECRCSVVAGSPSADCSGRRISDLSSLVDQLDADTTVLDLRFNELSVIYGNAFSALPSLSVILLDDNHIDTIEPHAFRNLRSIRLLSLTGNRITTLPGNAFSHLSGQEDVCAEVGQGRRSGERELSTCTIDISRNDLQNIERHSFAWIRHLEVVLGHGRLPLTVDAYAFYGARWMPRVSIENFPSVTLRPRIFTNTETVDLLEIKDTKINTLQRFVFEGLKDVKSVVFDRVDIGTIQSYALSGIHFRRTVVSISGDERTTKNRTVNVQEVDADVSPDKMSKVRRARYAQSGGHVSMTSCHIGVMATDTFRDANLAHVLLERTDVAQLEVNAFRGITGLQTLRSIDCRLGNTIRTDQFSSLRGLRQFHLIGLVDTRVVDPFAFRDTTDIDELFIHFRSDNVTLRTEAFGHASEIDSLQLRGSYTGSRNNAKTLLSVEVGAFRNLVGVGHLQLIDFRLPTLQRHSFSGLGRVTNLTISNCGVTDVEREAFGDVAGHVGAIGLLDLGVGNQLRCACGTASGMQREFDYRFIDYRAVCRVESVGGNSGALYIDVHQLSAEQTMKVCSSSSTLRTFYHSSCLLLVALVFSLTSIVVYR